MIVLAVAVAIAAAFLAVAVLPVGMIAGALVWLFGCRPC